MDFLFETNPTVDSIDKVPQDFRAFYAEADGKFVLDERFKATAKAYDGLNKTNRTLRDNEKASKTSLSAWAALGESPEAVAQSIADLNEQVKEKSKVDPEKIKQSVAAGYEAKLKDKDAEVAGLTTTLRTHLIGNAGTQALAEAKGSVDLLLPHIERQTQMVKNQDGTFSAVVVDAQGSIRYGVGGQPMTIAELVASMKGDKVFARAFESENAGGGGAAPGGAGQPQRRPSSQAPVSAIDKIKAGLEQRQRR